MSFEHAVWSGHRWLSLNMKQSRAICSPTLSILYFPSTLYSIPSSACEKSGEALCHRQREGDVDRKEARQVQMQDHTVGSDCEGTAPWTFCRGLIVLVFSIVEGSPDSPDVNPN